MTPEEFKTHMENISKDVIELDDKNMYRRQMVVA